MAILFSLLLFGSTGAPGFRFRRGEGVVVGLLGGGGGGCCAASTVVGSVVFGAVDASLTL